jgi:uncharacterized membrane protein
VTIESNRTLGGIGALLTLTGVAGTISSIFTIGTEGATNLAFLLIIGLTGLLSFVGFILFLISMNGFSKDYADQRIFQYIIYGFIGAIITGVVTLTTWAILTLANILTLNSQSIPSNSSDTTALLAPYISALTPVMAVAGLVWIYFNYKSYNLLADKSEVSLFRSAAKIFVLGAIVNIAVGAVFAILIYNNSIDYSTLALASVPGGLIQYLAWAFIAKGFFSIKAPSVQATTQQTYPTITTPSQYCSSCGAQNQTDSTYCVRCGKKLEP